MRRLTKRNSNMSASRLDRLQHDGEWSPYLEKGFRHRNVKNHFCTVTAPANACSSSDCGVAQWKYIDSC